MIITKKQYNAAAGLAYHRADLEYRKEHATSDSRITAAELDHDRANVAAAIDYCDALGVPWLVQNIALVWAEKWRNYASGYLWQELARRGVSVEG